MLAGDTLLNLYQRGAGTDAINRTRLLATQAAGKDADSLPIGEVDRRIWQLRAELLAEFGLPMAADALCPCPGCGEQLEFTLPGHFALPDPVATSAEVSWQGQRHPLRMPTLADFGPDGLNATNLGEGPWQDVNFAARAIEALQQSDPALGFDLGMNCPACGADFSWPFDAAAFFWAEVEELARQLVADVRHLAGAFGWPEQAILDMPPARRALYLAELAA